MVKCKPCEECRATTFGPSKSLTYATLPCDSSYFTNDCSTFFLMNACTKFDTHGVVTHKEPLAVIWTWPEDDSTPINVMDGSYYVTLEGISLGEKMLDIDPNFFKKNDTRSDDGVFVNSGATLTWLVPSAYQTLRKEMEQLPEGRAVVEIPNGAGVASLLLREHQSRSSRFSSDGISFSWWG